MPHWQEAGYDKNAQQHILPLSQHSGEMCSFLVAFKYRVTNSISLWLNLFTPLDPPSNDFSNIASPFLFSDTSLSEKHLLCSNKLHSKLT
jgi:hypothetical protein